MGWKNRITLFSYCLPCCSLRHDRASSFCLQARSRKATWKISFRFYNHYFQLPSSPLQLLRRPQGMSKLKGWLRASREQRVEKSLPVSVPGRIDFLMLSHQSLLTFRITRIRLENICNKKLCIFVLVIVNDTTAAVSSQLVAFNGAQNGMQRQFLKMKMSKLME